MARPPVHPPGKADQPAPTPAEEAEAAVEEVAVVAEVDLMNV